MTAAYNTIEERYEFLQNPLFWSDHHRLAAEVGKRCAMEWSELEETGMVYPSDTKGEDILKAVISLSKTLGIYLGVCAAEYYAKNQDHISYKEMKPRVIMNDVQHQVDILCTTVGVSEQHKWEYCNETMYAHAIDACIRNSIPEDLRETVKVNSPLLWHWINMTGYSFTTGDEEPVEEGGV